MLTENRFGEKGAQSLVNSLLQNNSLAVITTDTPLSQRFQGNVVRAVLEKNKQLISYKKMVKELMEKTEQLTRERDYYCEQLKLQTDPFTTHTVL